MADPRVTIIGATGAVGKIALEVLSQRNFAMSNLRLTASERSVGKKIDFAGTSITVEATTEEVFKETDIAFISANDDISRALAPIARQNNCIVIDDSGVWRMDEKVPLVVPEINASDLIEHSGIVSIPNCSTTPLAMVLDALRKENNIIRVIVATYQSVSGTGAAAVAELDQQSRNILDNKPLKIEQYPYQIAYNLIPQIGSFNENGYTSEELKMLNETRKILHEPSLPVSATCVRVPVNICHSESVNIQLERPLEVAKARELLANYPGIVVIDNPGDNSYPMPIDCTGEDEVFVGRVRQDNALENGLSLWIVSDNLRKGAATNAIQIAEEIIKLNAW